MDLNLKQKDYAKNEMIDPFMDRFVFALQQECKKLKDSFVSKNLDRILFHLMEHIAFRLEKIILQKQVSFVRPPSLHSVLIDDSGARCSSIATCAS